MSPDRESVTSTGWGSFADKRPLAERANGACQPNTFVTPQIGRKNKRQVQRPRIKKYRKLSSNIMAGLPISQKLQKSCN
jgi:hypothetical protein